MSQLGPPSTRGIIDEIIRRETGEYTDDPLDRGGPTRWGITLRKLQDHRPGATADDVRDLSEPAARAIYETDFIVKPGFNLLEDPLRSLMVDWGVTSDPSVPVRALQAAVGAQPDGKMGPETFELLAHRGADLAYASVLRARFMFYARIAQKDKTQLKWLGGWMARAAEFIR